LAEANFARHLINIFTNWVHGVDHRPSRWRWKSGLKRDGPIFFSSAPVKVAGDERTITTIIASHRSETNRVANISSGRAVLPRRPN
jgi:hypothetical protein